MSQEPDIQIMSVTFGDQWLEINFTEEREVSDDVVDIRSRLISPELFRERIQYVKEMLADILDEADIHRRNPPQVVKGLPGRRSLPAGEGD